MPGHLELEDGNVGAHAGISLLSGKGEDASTNPGALQFLDYINKYILFTVVKT
jgi:hypothetical protein